MPRSIPLVAAAFSCLALPLRSQGTALMVPRFARLEPGTCPACTVRLERVTIVGSPNDGELLTDTGLLYPLRDGERVASQTQLDAAPILRYDTTGHYVGPLGTIGDGPGEHQRVMAIASARGDSIAVLGPGRLTTISLASGRGRSVPLPVMAARAFRMFIRPDGAVLLQSYDERSPAFLLFDAEGRLLRAFGPAPKVVAGGRTSINQDAKARLIARSPAGGFWSLAQHFAHRLEHWADDGTALGVIDRPVPWFPPYDSAQVRQRGSVDPGSAPILPRGSSLWVSPDHRVFALTLVPDAHWQPDPVAARLPASGAGSPPASRALTGGIARYIDVVLEVYDEQTGALLGSWRSDGPTGWFGEDGLLYHETKDPDGVRVFQVFRLVLTEN